MKKLAVIIMIGLLSMTMVGCTGIFDRITNTGNSVASDPVYDLRFEILPEAEEFEEITGDFPETIKRVLKDTSGAGFVFYITTSSSYSQGDLEMLLGINDDGIITELRILNYGESKGSSKDFEQLFEGKNVHASDFVAGVTITSNAIKDAFSDASEVFNKYS